MFSSKHFFSASTLQVEVDFFAPPLSIIASCIAVDEEAKERVDVEEVAVEKMHGRCSIICILLYRKWAAQGNTILTTGLYTWCSKFYFLFFFISFSDVLKISFHCLKWKFFLSYLHTLSNFFIFHSFSFIFLFYII